MPESRAITRRSPPLGFVPARFQDRLVVAGKFVLGRGVFRSQLAAVSDAKTESGDKAILVDDTDFPAQFQAYLRGGRRGLERSFAPGQEDLSGVSAREASLFYEPFFFQALAVLSLAAPEYRHFGSSLPDLPSHPALTYLQRRFRDTVLEEVVPELVEALLLELDCSCTRVRVYRTSELRSSQTLKPNRRRKRSLLCGKEFSDVIRPKSDIIPTDYRTAGEVRVEGGDLLSLFEKAACEGYRQVLYLSNLRCHEEVALVETIYRDMRLRFPRDPRWQLQLETRKYC